MPDSARYPSPPSARNAKARRSPRCGGTRRVVGRLAVDADQAGIGVASAATTARTRPMPSESPSACPPSPVCVPLTLAPPARATCAVVPYVRKLKNACPRAPLARAASAASCGGPGARRSPCRRGVTALPRASTSAVSARRGAADRTPSSMPPLSGRGRHGEPDGLGHGDSHGITTSIRGLSRAAR